MLISFFNPSDLIGCGGDINQSDSFRYAEGVHRGGTLRGYAEEAHGGGMQRGTWRGYTEGYAEEVCGGVCGGGMWRGVQRWLPLSTINLVGDNREFEV